MYLFAFCLKHPKAPINIREKFSITNNIDKAYYHFNQQNIPILIISTCNRSELYTYLPTQEYKFIIQWWANFCNLDIDLLDNYAEIYTSTQAILHLFEVCCGLDSVVLGETQITGQIKQAYIIAKQYNSLNPFLHALIQKTLACAKDVRTNTHIGRFSVSFAAAGASLAQKIFNHMPEQNMLFIGAGEMMHTVVPHFSKYNPQQITIANRSFDNITKLINNRLKNYTQTINMISLNQIDMHLEKADIIISCIDYNNKYIINAEQIKNIMKARRYKPLYLLDLSVPLVMDKTIKNLDDVFFYNIDDLSNIIEEGQYKRITAKQEANIIINNYMNSLNIWQKQYNAKPLIQQINENLDLQVKQCLEYAFKKHSKYIKNNNLDELTLNILTHAMYKFSQNTKHDWLQLINQLDEHQQLQLETYFINKSKVI